MTENTGKLLWPCPLYLRNKLLLTQIAESETSADMYDPKGNGKEKTVQSVQFLPRRANPVICVGSYIDF